jgi:hypothetical protein
MSMTTEEIKAYIRQEINRERALGAAVLVRQRRDRDRQDVKRIVDDAGIAGVLGMLAGIMSMRKVD